MFTIDASGALWRSHRCPSFKSGSLVDGAWFVKYVKSSVGVWLVAQQMFNRNGAIQLSLDISRVDIPSKTFKYWKPHDPH